MIQLFEETSSTNDLALEKRHGAEHGACWVADRQTAGRGRREVGGERRQWFSPAGSNIYMSVILRPDLEPGSATPMTLAAGLGVADALVEQTGLDVWLKWPNDLFVGERKLGGLLTEAAIDDGEMSAIICGLGLNINVSADEVPDELSDIMTSVAIETGQTADRLNLVFDARRLLVERCDAYVDGGIDAILGDLRSYDRTTGRRVEISRDGDWIEGVSKGIGDRGQLTVEVDGEITDVQAGEVRFPEL
jgi:BirA family biotin operon repressor/biotin-[acetyl-CoA-carboxylase] ligase